MSITQVNFKRKLVGFGVLLGFFVFVIFSFCVVKAVAKAQEVDTITNEIKLDTEENIETRSTDPGVIKFAFLAAAIAVSVGALGAGAAVGYVGAAAMGAIGEKPELAGRALIFVGLAEGIAIYGLIIAIMILGKV
jgi:V/A-type H+-transporting ATPase subunit K